MTDYSFKINKATYGLIAFSLIAIGVIRYFNLDFIIADSIYMPTKSWVYQDSWVTNELMHKYGKYALILLYILFVIKFITRDKTDETSKQRYSRIILIFSILVGTFCVSLLKYTLDVDCPKDLIQYGGSKPYFSLFHYDQSLLPSAHCFPSGHASTAFTWISLYFYTTIFYPKWKNKALIAVLAIGFVFGIGQQFRGAHFLSHDFYSLLVCIAVNVLIYKTAFSQGRIRKTEVSQSNKLYTN
jgi:membrane-associated PAP2 superfamily phosphatase